jgi:trans-2-enoyl-CoA reductase
MNELLQIKGMTDVVFGVKDLITIGGSVIATVTAYLTLKFEFKAHKDAYEKEANLLKEELLNAKNGRRAIEKKAAMDLKEKDELIQKRIDKTQEKLDKEIEKNTQEFNKINETISGVKQDTSEIKGMIQMLINSSKK